MNRIDRLFAILLTLQNKRRIRAQDLANQFEISRRTVYRDMSALNQMGVPISALPGEGFELVEGYYIPPLMFNENEAIALLLASRLLTQQTTGSITPGAESALAKIKVALPEQVRSKAEVLTNIISFVTPKAKFNLDDPQLLLIQKAIQEKRVIHLHYHAYKKEQSSERDVEPHQLFYAEGLWYLEAYCRTRKGMRDFRLSRIDKATLQKETFGKKRTGKIQTQAIFVIKIRFEQNTVRWVREQQHYGYQKDEKQTPQNVTMTYHVNHESEIIPWILSWGASAEVLSPKELRKTLRETSLKMTNLLT
ncbi:MAG: YafY family transcriptional regulator [Anaerolineales bacterium]|nr:YafY family transcriptional regulator [Anaerolineales bacterium]